MLRLKSDLATGQERVHCTPARSYTAAEVRTDLAGRFDRYKTGEATLKSLREIRSARQKSLVAARRQARGHAGLQAAVAGRGREPGSPIADAGRRQGHEHYQFDDSDWAG